jgi:hypothetical protein
MGGHGAAKQGCASLAEPCIECAWMFERDVQGVRNLALGPTLACSARPLVSRHRVPAQLDKSCATSRTFREQRTISMFTKLATEYQQLI